MPFPCRRAPASWAPTPASGLALFPLLSALGSWGASYSSHHSSSLARWGTLPAPPRVEVGAWPSVSATFSPFGSLPQPLRHTLPHPHVHINLQLFRRSSSIFPSWLLRRGRQGRGQPNNLQGYQGTLCLRGAAGASVACSTKALLLAAFWWVGWVWVPRSACLALTLARFPR